MKTTIIFFFTLGLTLLITIIASAQPGLPGGPAQAPIDGGLALLAAIGGGYAIKKLRDKNKHRLDS